MSYSFKSQMGSGVPCTRNTRQGGSLPRQRGHKGCALYPDFIRHQTLLGARHARYAIFTVHIFTRGYPPQVAFQDQVASPQIPYAWNRRQLATYRAFGSTPWGLGLEVNLYRFLSSIHQKPLCGSWDASMMHPGFHTCSIKHGPFMDLWVPIVKDRVEQWGICQ